MPPRTPASHGRRLFPRRVVSTQPGKVVATGGKGDTYTELGKGAKLMEAFRPLEGCVAIPASPGTGGSGRFVRVHDSGPLHQSCVRPCCARGKPGRETYHTSKGRGACQGLSQLSFGKPGGQCTQLPKQRSRPAAHAQTAAEASATFGRADTKSSGYKSPGPSAIFGATASTGIHLHEDDQWWQMVARRVAVLSRRRP